MASDAPVITFEPAEWSDDTRDDLARIASHDGRDLIVFRTLIARGDMDLMDVLADGKRIGCLVWSICAEMGRNVLVVNACAARPVAGVSVAETVHESFRAFAGAIGCRKVRCWTKRPGLVRVLERAGYESAHYVMERETDGR